MKVIFSFLSFLFIILYSSCSHCDETLVVEEVSYLSYGCQEDSDCDFRIEKGQEYSNFNVKYPAEARENGIEGVVKVEFIVDIYGIGREHFVTSGLGYGCDEVALALVKNHNYAPAINECGDAIETTYFKNIKFRIE